MDNFFVFKYRFYPFLNTINRWVWIFCLFSFFTLPLQAQFQKKWDKLYGGSSYDELHEIHELSDGYIMMGSASFSFFADFPLTEGLADFWLYKTDLDGNIDWSYTYGSDSSEIFQTGFVLPTGECLLGGFSHGNIAGQHSSVSNGGRDMWVMKTDPLGNFLWDFAFGGDKEDYLVNMTSTSDGGVLLSGWTESTMSGTLTESSRGYFDFLIVKIDANGNYLWQKRFGGDNEDRGFSAIEASDGNIYFCGSSNSNISGDKTSASLGNNDYWLIKMDGNGNYIWDKSYGGTLSDQPNEIIETTDGNLILAGSSQSTINGNKTAPTYGGSDYWIVKIDYDGNILWDKSFGGSGNDDLHSIKQINKDNFIISGTSKSPIGNDKSEKNFGDQDFWTVIIDKDGNFLYDKTFGASKKEELKVALQTKDNGLILGGYTLSSNEDDVSDVSKGFQDNWVIKLDCDLKVNLPQDTMICYNQSFELKATTNYNEICKYDWSNNVHTPSNTVLVQSDTTFFVEVMDAFGCIAHDTFNIQVVPLPEIDLGPDQTICPNETIFITESSSFEHTWSDNSKGNAFEVLDSGTISLILTNNLGCESIDYVKISYFEEKETQITIDICEGESFFVEGALRSVEGIYHDTLHTFQFCDSVITTHLIVHLPDTTHTNDYVCNESQLGTLTDFYVNQYGCDSLVITELLLAPTDTTYFYEFSCDINDEEIWFTTETNRYGCDSFLIHDVKFVKPDTTQIAATTCDIFMAGIQTDLLSNFHGCDSLIITTTRYIPPDTVAVDQPTCFTEEIGIFHDTLSNQYGCDSFVTRNVILEDLQFTTKVNHITCPGESDGLLEINISLGTAPYRYSLNDNDYQLENIFDNLSPGLYNLTILDGNGCEWYESYILTEPEFIDFNIDFPILLQYGDSIQINPTFTVQPDTFYWTDNVGISCLDCIDPFLGPEIQSLYQLDFFVGACHVTKLVPVTVFHDRDVHIPSAFSPNGDGINDLFSIFPSKEVEMILDFKIYDRWGSQVYSRQNITMSEQPIPWDGKQYGKDLNSGVYGYFILVRYTDGKTLQFEGDITLLR